MIKLVIRFLTLIGSIIAFVAAISLNSNNLYFTSLSLFIGFLGTLIKTKKEATTQNTVKQKGGAFSQNTQNNYFSGTNGDNKK
ncbi:hypothetical protein AC068_06910 [Morganella morganii]|uniref:hypothetical protein n=1 Tax=Morganella morganii TaxID=582 RepID=UPI0006C0648B|nr:hypothetical protein [Morganella morganii]KOO19465.1 hypothetical protein AC068_06910 [Morganella morganii]